MTLMTSYFPYSCSARAKRTLFLAKSARTLLCERTVHFSRKSRDKILCFEIESYQIHTSVRFKNFHNSLHSLEYQYSVHNSLLHLLSNFQGAITSQNIA